MMTRLARGGRRNRGGLRGSAIHSTAQPSAPAVVRGGKGNGSRDACDSFSPAGRGWGEGGLTRGMFSDSEPPHPLLPPKSGSKPRVTALMGEKGRSSHVALCFLRGRKGSGRLHVRQ